MGLLALPPQRSQEERKLPRMWAVQLCFQLLSAGDEAFASAALSSSECPCSSQ
eukprot:SAG31_NODE_35715_length_320_cov_1.158371_1_plen_52_part_01